MTEQKKHNVNETLFDHKIFILTVLAMQKDDLLAFLQRSYFRVLTKLIRLGNSDWIRAERSLSLWRPPMGCHRCVHTHTLHQMKLPHYPWKVPGFRIQTSVNHGYLTETQAVSSTFSWSHDGKNNCCKGHYTQNKHQIFTNIRGHFSWCEVSFRAPMNIFSRCPEEQQRHFGVGLDWTYFPQWRLLQTDF